MPGANPRILVTLDGSVFSESALPVAAKVARSLGGEVILLRVVAPPTEDEGQRSDGALPPPAELERRRTDEQLQSLTALFDDAEVRRVVLISADPARDIIGWVYVRCGLRGDGDARPHRPAPTVAGSVTEAVLRSAAPVIAVRPPTLPAE
ncbi:MAG: universal stress protein [Dehalococcoidia bacterium]